MKTITIRFDNCIANWINYSSQRNRFTISEFIRNMLYEKMKQGQIVINHIKNKEFIPTQQYRSEIGYNIYAAKLLEGFILGTGDKGVELSNKAFTATEDMLAGLNLNVNKTKVQQFCVNLEQELYTWLNQEANRLQLKIATLIRKLIEQVALEELPGSDRELHSTQKIGIEHQVKTYKLLEVLINNTVNDPEKIINKALDEAKNTLLKLFSGSENVKVSTVKNKH